MQSKSPPTVLYTGFLPAGDMPAVRQPEAVLPQQMACFPQQLPLQSQGKGTQKPAAITSDLGGHDRGRRSLWVPKGRANAHPCQTSYLSS